jgi:mono/diheme cytochrome c family protein
MFVVGYGKLSICKNEDMLRGILAIQFFLFFSLISFSQGNPSTKVTPGAKVYQQYCMSCHQADGGGVPRMTPPLVNTEYVTGDKKRLISILLKGLNEPIIVNEEEYYNPMASFSFLSDQQIAAVLTFIRTQFDNKSTPVSAQEVSLVRKQVAVKK